MSAKLNSFFTNIDMLVEAIDSKKSELVDILTHYETHDTALDEIERSLTTLKGMRKEFKPIQGPLENLTVTTFFPLNLPLYSLVLFAIAPSAFSKDVFIRPPEVMYAILPQLWDMLDIHTTFPNIEIKQMPRHIFVQLYAAESDVIIFTGKYENALDIHEKAPGSLLLYNGSGINPFLLFKDADVSLAVQKAIEMRCFNSGQDCAGPDIFMVPTELADAFTRELVHELQDIKVGDTTDPSVNVGPTVKVAYIQELLNWLKDEQEHIILKGEIDTKNRFVHPTVVRKKIEEHGSDDFHEFFAPLFYVLEYDSDEKLKQLITSEKFKKRGMYISIFGHNEAVEKELGFVKILHDQIVNDVEYGNGEYGGYGDEANFTLIDGKKTTKPILISRDIHLCLAPQSYRQ